MKILSAEEIRLWDQYTFQHEPIASIDLMERAAGKCVEWIEQNEPVGSCYNIFCGKGNNGGDGLAIARMLAAKSYPVAVYILEFGHKGTNDFQTNLARLHQFPEIKISFIQSEKSFPTIIPGEMIIDALFGSGLNRKLEGVTALLVEYINNCNCKTISIDIPSGMFVDRSSKDNVIIKAGDTLSFQCLKPAFLVAENADYTGEVHILEIGLHKGFYQSVAGVYEWINEEVIRSIHKPRKRFAHKGNFGHGLLVAGSYGKMGAA